MKISVVTTFPVDHFDVCAKEMLESFVKYWPEDIGLYIQVDEMPEDQARLMNNKILDATGEGRCNLSFKFDDEQKAFIERWKDHKPQSYLGEAIKFSHKVFALEKCGDALKNDIDYLIWLDADVITKSKVDYEWLKKVLPANDEVVCYLDRKGLHSECGFVAYNMKNGGYDLLLKMKNEYVLDGILTYEKGVTDCHVLDTCLEGKKYKSLCPNYKYGRDDINVWPESVLAERMVHRKGRRKFDTVKVDKPVHQQQSSGVVNAGEIKIKTRNCLDHGKIKSNVQANLSQIRAWATLCKQDPDAEIVMCAAGPSLPDHIDEIKALQASGAKVVAVKHAIDTLKTYGIKPWAVVLLDPRGHVEGFVKTPDTDPIYFVASMCDPSVVQALNDAKCTVIGYHAFVNAGETDIMVHSDLPVSGGSATSTRSIGLFSDMLGVKKFHLFGYDLSYQQKPNMDELNTDGQKKYMELSIGTQSYKGKQVSRTFWTEGQFLAQKNEIELLYKDRKDISLTLYGDGMAAWLWRHFCLYKKYQLEYNQRLENARVGSCGLDEFIETISAGAKLSRGR